MKTITCSHGSAARTEDAAAAWSAMTALVFDNRNDWRREVVAVTGMQFSRTRVLRRLRGGPLSLKELAAMAVVDAPAATVIVNDLEKRGYVARCTQPDDRRRKLVSLTKRGRELLERIDRIDDPPPSVLLGLDDEDLATLARILRTAHPAEYPVETDDCARTSSQEAGE